MKQFSMMLNRRLILVFLATFVFCRISYAVDSLGTLKADFKVHANSLLADPNLPYVYATTDSALEVIDTNTLTVKAVLSGGGGGDMSLSPDGSRLYISNSSVYFNTQTQTLQSLAPISAGNDFVEGLDGRFYGISGTGVNTLVYQTDANGSYFNRFSISFSYNGRLQISPDRKSLYYGTTELSPATLYKFDVSTATPVELFQDRDNFGSNGEQLVVSHNGTMLSFVTGSGYKDHYTVPIYQTQDMSEKSVLGTNPYPLAMAFSPNDLLGYTLNDSPSVDVFDTATSQHLGQFYSLDAGSSMQVDKSGKYLFISLNGRNRHDTDLVVYSTGLVPEPSSAALLLVAVVMAGVRRLTQKL